VSEIPRFGRLVGVLRTTLLPRRVFIPVEGRRAGCSAVSGRKRDGHYGRPFSTVTIQAFKLGAGEHLA
jgi:hypothetical protein